MVIAYSLFDSFVQKMRVYGLRLTEYRTRLDFRDSEEYWERLYAKGGDSGAGSFGQYAEFKAEILNRFVQEHGIRSVIEFGCGDGNQLSMAAYPSYLGVDVSPTAIERCRKRFAGDPTHSFCSISEYDGQKAELALSLDVIHYLVEDATYQEYLDRLFSAARCFVILYCSNLSDEEAERRNVDSNAYVRHRHVTRDVAKRFPAWQLTREIPNRYPHDWETKEGSFADFYIYENRAPISCTFEK